MAHVKKHGFLPHLIEVECSFDCAGTCKSFHHSHRCKSRRQWAREGGNLSPVFKLNSFHCRFLQRVQPTLFVGLCLIPQSFQSRKSWSLTSVRVAPNVYDSSHYATWWCQMKPLAWPMLAPLRKRLLTQKPFFILSLCYLLFENLMNIKMKLNPIPQSWIKMKIDWYDWQVADIH